MPFARSRRTDNSPVGAHVRGEIRDAVRLPLEDVVREASLCHRYHAVTFRPKPPYRRSVTGHEPSAAAGRALEALRLVLPSGVEVASLAVRNKRGTTAVDIQIAADDARAADRFAARLCESRRFAVVNPSAPAAKAEPGAGRFHLRLSSGAEDGR